MWLAEKVPLRQKGTSYRETFAAKVPVHIVISTINLFQVD